jgi:aryl-alcohol dehydrogenase-like predicted oxidoreductase
MKTNKLGNSDLDLTTIGFGTWAIGGDNWGMGWGAQDDQESIKVIQQAIDLGINWIDTAAIYGMGHSEEVVGKAVAGRRDQVHIATKGSLVWDHEKKVINNVLNADGIRKEVEDSLRRLNIETIDLYQIHVPMPDEDIEEGWGCLADLIKEGKIRYAGVSNFSIEQLKRIQPIHPVASLQPPYSMLKREIEEDLLGYCAQNQIGVIVYSPMQAGLLTGTFSKERLQKLDANDWRLEDVEFQGKQFEINLDFVDELRPIAEGKGRPLSQLAIAWVLRRPEVTAAIVGARRSNQIEQTVGATEWVLSQTEISEIDKFLAERDQALADL